MPRIFEPEVLPLLRRRGVSQTTLGTAAMLGTEALQVERIRLDANTTTAVFSAIEGERFLYVIHGAGIAHVGNEEFPLAPESILWIEAEDRYTLQSRPEGLEVLVCRAPVTG